VRNCGPLTQVPCNEAEVVRLAYLNSKKIAIKIKIKLRKYLK